MSFNVPKSDKKRVVIVGGGFGGLQVANRLKHSDFQVVLIDRNNYHQFPPLIYQIPSAGLEPRSSPSLSAKYINVERTSISVWLRYAPSSLNKRFYKRP